MSSVLCDLCNDCACENVACGRCVCLQMRIIKGDVQRDRRVQPNSCVQDKQAIQLHKIGCHGTPCHHSPGRVNSDRRFTMENPEHAVFGTLRWRIATRYRKFETAAVGPQDGGQFVHRIERQPSQKKTPRLRPDLGRFLFGQHASTRGL